MNEPKMSIHEYIEHVCRLSVSATIKEYADNGFSIPLGVSGNTTIIGENGSKSGSFDIGFVKLHLIQLYSKSLQNT